MNEAWRFEGDLDHLTIVKETRIYNWVRLLNLDTGESRWVFRPERGKNASSARETQR